MKILTANQMQEADRATIKSEPISSLDLMERASGLCVQRILKEERLLHDCVHVLTGVGNNGGDGLVIARKLAEHGLKVRCYVLNFSTKRSPDFEVNLLRLNDQGNNHIEINGIEDLPDLGGAGCIVDAIFGTGLKRSPEGWIKQVIQKINESQLPVIAIDIPSGLFCNSQVSDIDAVVKADLTLSFQNPKMAFLLPSNSEFVGKWQLLDIGLNQEFINDLTDCPELVDFSMIRKIYKKRNRFSHKGSFGHSLLMGGSFGKIGAVILASKAALRAGSGLVSAYVPKCGYSIVQTSIPEVMVEIDDEHFLQFFNYRSRATSIGIGPGLGTHLKTKKGFVHFLKNAKVPLVIDADGLNIISEHEEIAQLIPPGSILTPHPGEFERLVGPWKNDYDKLDKQMEFSSSHRCVLVLKGAHTTIVSGNTLYVNNTGNPGLATAGSGDVLTGLLTGLVAQGYPPFEAAVLGIFLHGRAADLAIEENESTESFIASDIIKYLGRAIKEI